MKNNVWEVVPKHEWNSIVTSRWIYKIKYACDGSIQKYKSIFMACDFSQKEGIDYDEIVAPISMYTTI